MSGVNIATQGLRMKFIVGRIGAIALALWLVMPTTGHAECVSPGFNPSGTFCNGCKYEGAMSMSRDQTCVRPYSPGATGLGTGIANPMTILSNRVIQRAKHGIAGANGNTFAYCCCRQGIYRDGRFRRRGRLQAGHRERGKFTIHWNVTVQ